MEKLNFNLGGEFMLYKFLVITIMLWAGNIRCQDPNLSLIKDLSHYDLQFDTVKNYYSFVQFKFDDKNFGVAQYSYYGPDSLRGHAEYMTLAPFKDGKKLRKGIGYELYMSGTFLGVVNYDWNGNKHGNFMEFHLNGAIKLNEIWERGKLIKSWSYTYSGKLIEYKEYD